MLHFSFEFALFKFITSFVAFGLPFLMGYGVLPLTNFFAEIVSVIGLAFIGLWLCRRPIPIIPLRSTLSPVVIIPLLLIGATLVQYAMAPHGLEAAFLERLLFFLLAIVSAIIGWVLRQEAEVDDWMTAIAKSVMIAGVLAALGSISQFFSLNGSVVLLSPVTDAGRTYGFIRQPNHQATFLCIGLTAVFWTQARQQIKTLIALSIGAILIFAIVTTGSRTGLIELFFVSLMGSLLNRGRLLDAVQKLALSFGLTIGLWLLLHMLSTNGVVDFYGTQKLAQTSTEGIGLRWSLWQETWQLIMEAPILGQGILAFGSLFFLSGAALKTSVLMSNAHNLPLQLAFDFGIPVAITILLLANWHLWSARAQVKNEYGWFALTIIGCILIHSMLEFPLWYAYFLIPFFFWMGFLKPSTSPAYMRSSTWRQGSWFLFCMSMLGISVWMNQDYYRITPVYMHGPANNLIDRLAESEKSFWFDRFRHFGSLERNGVNERNVESILSDYASLGCIMNEPWYQRQMILALARTGYLADVRWLLYLYTSLGKSSIPGLSDELRKLPNIEAQDLAENASNLINTPKSIRVYLEYCR